MITWTNRLTSIQILTRLASSRRLTEAERDACAAVVDQVSELASERESLSDEIDGYYSQLMTAVKAAGAPDMSSLVARIDGLRREATAAELAREEFVAIHVALTEADVPECLPGDQPLSEVERIERLAKERGLQRALYHKALERECYVRKEAEERESERVKWVSMYHDANDRLAAIGEAMGFEDPEGLEDAVRALKSRLAELESRPLSPEVARVIHNARVLVGLELHDPEALDEQGAVWRLARMALCDRVKIAEWWEARDEDGDCFCAGAEHSVNKFIAGDKSFRKVHVTRYRRRA
jgi:hypothetical protein